MTNYTLVNDPPPVVDSFTAAPASGNDPATVTFNGSGHDTDPAKPQPIANYTLDFGDGTSLNNGSSPIVNVQHPYTKAGTFDATLTLTDSDGGTVEQVTPVTVNPVDPLPVVTLSAVNATPGLAATGPAPLTAVLNGSATISSGTIVWYRARLRRRQHVGSRIRTAWDRERGNQQPVAPLHPGRHVYGRADGDGQRGWRTAQAQEVTVAAPAAVDYFAASSGSNLPAWWTVSGGASMQFNEIKNCQMDSLSVSSGGTESYLYNAANFVNSTQQVSVKCGSSDPVHNNAAFGLEARVNPAGNTYYALQTPSTQAGNGSGGTTFNLVKVVDGVQTILGSYTMTGTFTVGTWWNIESALRQRRRQSRLYRPEGRDVAAGHDRPGLAVEHPQQRAGAYRRVGAGRLLHPAAQRGHRQSREQLLRGRQRRADRRSGPPTQAAPIR